MLTTILHAAVNVLQKVRRQIWFVSRPRTLGVHAVPLTPEGRLVLVTLSYAKGWRLPGGGRKASEDPRGAVLRELREEIGLTAHGPVELVCDFTHRPDFRQGQASLFVVRDVEYRPRWSLEVKNVAEFDVQALPPDTAAITRRLLAKAKAHLT